MSRILIGIAIVVAVIIGGVVTNGSQTSSPEGAVAGVGDKTGAQQNSNTKKSVLPSKALVYDVRTPEEFRERRIQQALNHPLDTLSSESLSSVPKDSPIYIYCRSGNRSAQAARIFLDAGFTNVTDMGGIDSAVAAYGFSTASGSTN